MSAPPSNTSARNGVRTIFTVGFCFGGRNSWLAAAGRSRLCGRGRFLRPPRRGQRRGAGADAARRPRSRRRSSRSRRAQTRTSRPRTTPRSTRRSTAAGVEHEVVTYDGAPHSFFDRKQEEFAAASDDAWAKVPRVHRRPLRLARLLTKLLPGSQPILRLGWFSAALWPKPVTPWSHHAFPRSRARARAAGWRSSTRPVGVRGRERGGDRLALGARRQRLRRPHDRGRC